MNKQTEESKFNELLSYLSLLIQETIYPYGHQAKGIYKATNLNKEIYDCFHLTITLIEKLPNDENTSLRKETILKNLSNIICTKISINLDTYFLEKSKNGFFILDYKIFSKDVFNKAQQIMLLK